MKKKVILLTTFFCATALIALMPRSNQKLTQENIKKRKITQEVLSKYNRKIHFKINNGLLRIHCPSGVLCDKKSAYRAITHTFKSKDFEVFLYLNFSNKLIGNINEKSIKKYFEYMYSFVDIRNPQLSDWGVRHGGGGSQIYRKGDNHFKIIGYKNGILHGQLKLPNMSFRAKKQNGVCGWMDTRLPADCFFNVPSGELEIDFKLFIEDGVLDCKKKSNQHRCG